VIVTRRWGELGGRWWFGAASRDIGIMRGQKRCHRRQVSSIILGFH